MLVVARQVKFYLLALRFRLLQAQDIGVVGCHKAGKLALINYRANTVDVPGVEIHKDSIADSDILVYYEVCNYTQAQGSLIYCELYLEAQT